MAGDEVASSPTQCFIALPSMGQILTRAAVWRDCIEGQGCSSKENLY